MHWVLILFLHGQQVKIEPFPAQKTCQETFTYIAWNHVLNFDSWKCVEEKDNQK
jgi:hypothetical protein